MKCILVLEEGLEPEEKRDFNGNYFLYHLLGAENVIVKTKRSRSYGRDA